MNCELIFWSGQSLWNSPVAFYRAICNQFHHLFVATFYTSTIFIIRFHECLGGKANLVKVGILSQRVHRTTCTSELVTALQIIYFHLFSVLLFLPVMLAVCSMLFLFVMFVKLSATFEHIKCKFYSSKNVFLLLVFHLVNDEKGWRRVNNPYYETVNPEQDYFNAYNFFCRKFVDQTSRSVVNWWRILWSPTKYSVEGATKMIMVCCKFQKCSTEQLKIIWTCYGISSNHIDNEVIWESTIHFQNLLHIEINIVRERHLRRKGVFVGQKNTSIWFRIVDESVSFLSITSRTVANGTFSP